MYRARLAQSIQRRSVSNGASLGSRSIKSKPDNTLMYTTFGAVGSAVALGVWFTLTKTVNRIGGSFILRDDSVPRCH